MLIRPSRARSQQAARDRRITTSWHVAASQKRVIIKTICVTSDCWRFHHPKTKSVIRVILIAAKRKSHEQKRGGQEKEKFDNS